MDDQLPNQSLDTFLSQLASKQPTPGGGSVVALLGAQAAALLAMALRVSGGELADGPQAAWLKTLDAERAEFLRLAVEDGSAFGAVSEAYRLPRSDEEARQKRLAAIQVALRQATAVPLKVMSLTSDLLDEAGRIVEHVKPSIASDVGVALRLIDAGLKASRYNIWTNLRLLDDSAFRTEVKDAAARLLTGSKSKRRAIHKRVRQLIRSQR